MAAEKQKILQSNKCYLLEVAKNIISHVELSENFLLQFIYRFLKTFLTCLVTELQIIYVSSIFIELTLSFCLKNSQLDIFILKLKNLEKSDYVITFCEKT